MKHAFIIGCGYTGTALLRRLITDGISVSGISYSSFQVEGITIAATDLIHPAPLDLSAAKGAVVYYMVPPLMREYDPVGRPHLAVISRVLSAVASAAVQGVIYLSSTAVYGDQRGGWVDEHTPPFPLSPWGKMRREIEEEFIAFGNQHAVPVGVVRLPEIYGPGRGPVQRLRQGQPIHLAPRYSNRIYIDDLVEILFTLGERLDQPLLLAADNHPAPVRDVYQYAARLLDLPLVTDETESHLAHLDSNRRAMLTCSRRCDNHRLRQWLGKPLRYSSYLSGIPATMNYVQRGALE